MAYIGRTPSFGEVIVLKNIESSFNGTLTGFDLHRVVNGVDQDFYAISSEHLLVSLGGVLQEPDRSGNVGFTINGNQIEFAVAPPTGTSCFIISYGHILDIGVASDGTVTSTKIASPGPSWDSAGSLSINGTGYVDIPAGTTAQRPGSPNTGMLRFNTNFERYEGYDGSSWGSLGGASGSGGDAVFYENDINVTTNYTITSNKNAMSAGPITINNSATVTIPNGTTWTVV
jgi:hypothetical protein